MNLKRPSRLRDRLFPILTVHVAALYVVGAWYMARHVGTINAARAIGALMTAHMTSAPAVTPGMRPNLFSAIMGPQTVTPEQREAQQKAAREIAAVEVISFIWERGIWVTAGLLDLLALLGVLTGRVRGFHLAAAGVILLATAGTLIAMQLLIHPEYGAMPPLSGFSHVLVGWAQGFYGLILLLAFWKRPRSLGPMAAGE